MHCIECGANIEETKETRDGQEKYVCSDGHENPRMITHEGLEKSYDGMEVIHHSVGAIVKAEGKILLLKRRKFPYSYSIPAGHLEEGEDPDRAVLRELEEETGITDVQDQTKIWEGKMYDECRRGADHHYWHLYTVDLDEMPEVEGNDEAEHLSWVQNPLDNKLTDATEKILKGKVVELSVDLARKFG